MSHSPTPGPAITKATPIFIVQAIEPCLEFWVKRLGFEKTIEVPHEDRLGFVALQSGPIEVMYQSLASVAADAPTVAAAPSRSTLYCEVDDLDRVIAALDGCAIVLPRRKTFYGADEIYYREPGGNVIGFAAFAKG